MEQGAVNVLGIIEELSRTFPVKRTVDAEFIGEVYRSFASDTPEDAIITIKNHMDLTKNKLKVKYFNDHPYFKEHEFNRQHVGDWGLRVLIRERFINDYFYRITEEPASIMIPTDLPYYGTREFFEVRILLRIGKSLLCQKDEYFMAAVAHELSHFLLYSLRHSLAKSEAATDILSMMLGFGEIVSQNSEVGYLSEEQRWVAYSIIRNRQR